MDDMDVNRLLVSLLFGEQMLRDDCFQSSRPLVFTCSQIHSPSPQCDLLTFRILPGSELWTSRPRTQVELDVTEARASALSSAEPKMLANHIKLPKIHNDTYFEDISRPVYLNFSLPGISNRALL